MTVREVNGLKVEFSEEMENIYSQFIDGLITIEEIAMKYLEMLRLDGLVYILQYSFDSKQAELAKGIVR
jgi:hypothetical protein